MNTDANGLHRTAHKLRILRDIVTIMAAEVSGYGACAPSGEV